MNQEGFTRDLTLPYKVNIAEFSIDGNVLFLGMANGSIAILNLQQDTMIEFDGQRGSVESIVAIDSDSFATGHPDGRVHFWTTDGMHLNTIRGDRGMVLSLDYDSEEGKIAIGSIDGTVQVWRLGESQPTIRIHGHGGGVRSLVFLESDKLLSGGDDGNIVVWNLTDDTRHTFDAQHGGVMDLSLLDSVVASAGLDGVIRLWSVDTFELLETLLGHDDLIWSIDSIDKQRFVSVGRDGSVRWWNATPATPETYRASSSMPASDIAFVTKGALAVVSEFDSDIQVIDVVNNQSNVIPSTNAELTTVAFLPNTSFVVTGNLEGDIHLWDFEKLQKEKLIWSCDGQITTIDVSPDGNRISAATINGQVCVFDLRDKKLLFDKMVSDSLVLAISFGADGSELFVSTIDGSITTYDVNSESMLWRTIGSGGDIIAIKYVDSRDAIITATASKTLQLLNAKDGAVLGSREATGGVLRDIALFANESRFVTASSDGTVGVWDTATFNLIASIPAKQSLESISVSLDGDSLAIAGGSANIRLMDGGGHETKMAEQKHD